ncbi:MAG TPA: hypothetical protein PK511_11090 [Chitinophagales bacterium]|nr:hypothetical protein [Chitinophagales bacterium]HMU68590.1 hypothetical protein [Chitinophagales bacterium]HMX04302.1 hypothetical protein [Chitinophagales bacterium]HMZ89578.1 hypothetical protein [Chitinophagales bacterium]HNE47066.1 hypothetical protein [Chitinophagales bacterium]
MKSMITGAAALIFFLTTAFYPGDNCESYFANKVGTSMEQTSYDAKGKMTSKSVSTVKAYDAIDGGFASTLNVRVMDAKDKEVSNSDVIMKCQQDKFYMDLSNAFPKEMAGMEGAEVEMENTFVEFPAHPVAGQSLPDQTSSMTIKLNGTPFMTMTINTTNRKVEGFESMTTTAGTFECMKYSADTEVKSMFTSKSHSVMWMSKNVGLVKMESYDDKGKLQATQMLTKFSE